MFIDNIARHKPILRTAISSAGTGGACQLFEEPHRTRRGMQRASMRWCCAAARSQLRLEPAARQRLRLLVRRDPLHPRLTAALSRCNSGVDAAIVQLVAQWKGRWTGVVEPLGNSGPRANRRQRKSQADGATPKSQPNASMRACEVLARPPSKNGSLTLVLLGGAMGGQLATVVHAEPNGLVARVGGT